MPPISSAARRQQGTGRLPTREGRWGHGRDRGKQVGGAQATQRARPPIGGAEGGVRPRKVAPDVVGRTRNGGGQWKRRDCGWASPGANRNADGVRRIVSRTRPIPTCWRAQTRGPEERGTPRGWRQPANQGTTAADGRARRRMGNKDCGRPVGKRREAGAGLQAANHRPLRTAGGPAALLGTLGVSVGACEGVFQG